MYITHSQVLSLEVIHAFDAAVGRKGGMARAGRTVSGLLKAAAKAGRIQAVRSYGRITASTGYEMTEQQIEDIRALAIAKAATL